MLQFLVVFLIKVWNTLKKHNNYYSQIQRRSKGSCVGASNISNNPHHGSGFEAFFVKKCINAGSFDFLG